MSGPSTDSQLSISTAELREKEATLRGWIRRAERVVVALSGGVDSAVLLRVAVDELAHQALAVIAAGPSLPERDRDDAVALARACGARHELVSTDEFADPRYLANGPDRCFWCRASLARAMAPIAARERARMVYGAIVDDLADDRPGMRAAADGGVEAPLLIAGFGKQDVRRLAHQLGLTVWNKPASACLSSRIPTGRAIDPARLERIDRAERELLACGFDRVRVRDHGGRAQVELDPEELSRVAGDPVLRQTIDRIVRSAGWDSVEIDPTGYLPAGLRRRLPTLPDPSASS